MAIWRTQYDAHDRVTQNPGSRIKQLYTAKVDRDGVIDLCPSGTENIYDYIQSFRDSVDINVIIQRFANGDVNALNKVQGNYGDFTEFPKTYAEMLNVVIAGREYFDSLPVEIKAKFNHSFAEWLSDMDNMPEWLKMMGLSEDASAGVSEDKPAAADAGRAESASKGKPTAPDAGRAESGTEKGVDQ